MDIEKLEQAEKFAHKAWRAASKELEKAKKEIERPALERQYIGKCFKRVDYNSDKTTRYVQYSKIVRFSEWNEPICFEISETHERGRYTVSIQVNEYTYLNLLGKPIPHTQFAAAHAKMVKRIAIPDVPA